MVRNLQLHNKYMERFIIISRKTPISWQYDPNCQKLVTYFAVTTSARLVNITELN